jgi:ribosomal protein S18 acetylase RimI-like enzyme
MITISPLDPSKTEAAISTISQAFFDDPMYDIILPDKAKRMQGLNAMNAFVLNICMRSGQVDSIAGTSGVALWLPPGKTDLTPVQMLQAGGLTLPFRAGFGPFLRLMSMLGKGDPIHKKAVPGPHWYLAILAVEPLQQGKGFGKALIEHGLARADVDHMPCYLETSNERNKPFYERYGFKVFESFALAEGGPEGWGMLRDPAVS